MLCRNWWTGRVINTWCCNSTDRQRVSLQSHPSRGGRTSQWIFNVPTVCHHWTHWGPATNPPPYDSLQLWSIRPSVFMLYSKFCRNPVLTAEPKLKSERQVLMSLLIPEDVFFFLVTCAKLYHQFRTSLCAPYVMWNWKRALTFCALVPNGLVLIHTKNIKWGKKEKCVTLVFYDKNVGCP